MGAEIDLTGRRYNMWTVIKRAPDHIQPNGQPVPYWECRCDCGTVREVAGSGLRRNEAYSCGCVRRRPGEKVHKTPENPRVMPRLVTIQNKLVIGRTYRIDGKRWTLIGLYEHFGRFEDKRGDHQCWLYWDLERILR